MSWYVPVQPRSSLDRWLACSWTAHPSGPHRLVPDGCIDVLWTSHGELVICGPESEAWTFELPVHTTAAGVRFRPGVAPALFGFDAARLHNRRASLETIDPAAVSDRLRQSLARSDSPDAQRIQLESWAGSLIGAREPDTSWSDAVIDELIGSPGTTLSSVALAVGLTTRQLHRRSLVRFGYSPKVLDRLLRFQRFLAVRSLGPDWSLGRLAAEAGYSDHAHLARECRAITGSSPTAFLTDYFPTFPEMSDPFKTSPPLVASMMS